MDSIWNERIVVRSYDVGCEGVLKHQALFQFFQEAAANHATHLGVGHDALQARGVFWALSRVKVVIAALPAWRDTITLTTWPKGVDKLFALRDFRMTDGRGAVLVRGTSCWLLVDVEKLRPRRVETLERDFPLNDKEHALQEVPGKIAVPASLEPRNERHVMTSDLDINNHVNNTEYIRWIVDALGPEEGETASIGTLQVNFLEEVHRGDTILFSAGRDAADPSVAFVEGQNGATGGKVVQARVERAVTAR
jgi:acyl-ACP thioesterase